MVPYGFMHESALPKRRRLGSADGGSTRGSTSSHSTSSLRSRSHSQANVRPAATLDLFAEAAPLDLFSENSEPSPLGGPSSTFMPALPDREPRVRPSEHSGFSAPLFFDSSWGNGGGVKRVRGAIC